MPQVVLLYSQVFFFELEQIKRKKGYNHVIFVYQIYIIRYNEVNKHVSLQTTRVLWSLISIFYALTMYFFKIH